MKTYSEGSPIKPSVRGSSQTISGSGILSTALADKVDVSCSGAPKLPVACDANLTEDILDGLLRCPDA